MTFDAFHSPIGGRWWVRMAWPRCRYRYGGESLIWPVPADDADPEATATAVAAEMQSRIGGAK